MSIGEIFGVVGGSHCSDMSFSNFRKPFSKISSFSSVLAPLAWESARACSNATKRSSSELGPWCCAGFMAKGGTKGGLRGDFGQRNLLEQVWAGVGPGSCLG